MIARDVGSFPWRRELAGIFSAFQALFLFVARSKTRLDEATRSKPRPTGRPPVARHSLGVRPPRTCRARTRGTARPVVPD